MSHVVSCFREPSTWGYHLDLEPEERRHCLQVRDWRASVFSGYFMIGPWFDPGLILVWSWFDPGLILVWSWFDPGLILVWFWFDSGLILVWSWFDPGLILVSSWFHPGFILVWFWFDPGLILIWSWFDLVWAACALTTELLITRQTLNPFTHSPCNIIPAETRAHFTHPSHGRFSL